MFTLPKMILASEKSKIYSINMRFDTCIFNASP